MEVFLKSIGAAATNPLAFAAYLAAIICWLILRIRVDRNKNLLDRLQSIPEDQRAGLVRDEMGTDEVRGGVTAEQRLKSRIHRYYFLAFCVLCGVAVALFAITRFNKPVPKPDPTTVQKVEVVNDQDAAEDHSVMRKLNLVNVHVSQAFVRSKLGEPDSQGKLMHNTCWGYVLPKAKVTFLFGSHGEVKMFAVVVTDKNYRFPLLGKWGYDETAGSLGNFSFSAARDEQIRNKDGSIAKLPDADERLASMSSLVNLAASRGNPQIYMEKYQHNSPSDPEDLYFIESSDGYEITPEQLRDQFDAFVFAQAMPESSVAKKFTDAEAHKILDQVKPNGFAYLSRPAYGDVATFDQNDAEAALEDGAACSAQ